MAVIDAIVGLTSWLATFIKGALFGVLLVAAIQGFLLFRFAQKHLNPSRKRSSSASNNISGEKALLSGSIDVNGKDTTNSLPTLLLNSAANNDTKTAEETSIITSWPENIVAYLTKAITNPDSTISEETTTDTEPCFWLNVVLHRYFLELRQSEYLKEKWMAKILEKLAAKIEKNSLILGIQVNKIAFGNNPPILHGIRLLQTQVPHPNLQVVCEVDITYQGGFQVIIETSIAGGLSFPVSVVLEELVGKLRIRLPSPRSATDFQISFPVDPNPVFTVKAFRQSSSSEGIDDKLENSDRIVNMVNKLLEKKLRAVFLDMVVSPAWRSFNLPLLTPSSSSSSPSSSLSALSTSSGAPTQPPSKESTTESEQQEHEPITMRKPTSYMKPPNKTHKVVSGVASSISYMSRNISPLIQSTTTTLHSGATKSFTSMKKLKATMKLRSSSVSDNILRTRDVLEDVCFPSSMVVSETNFVGLKDRLVDVFLDMVVENTDTQPLSPNADSSDKHSISEFDSNHHSHHHHHGGWVAVKGGGGGTAKGKTDGITVETKTIRVLVSDDTASVFSTTSADSLATESFSPTQQDSSATTASTISQFTRSQFSILTASSASTLPITSVCNQLFKLISNPDHFRHVFDGYLGYEVVETFTEVGNVTSEQDDVAVEKDKKNAKDKSEEEDDESEAETTQIIRIILREKDVYVLAVKKRVINPDSLQKNWIVCWRSIAGYVPLVRKQHARSETEGDEELEHKLAWTESLPDPIIFPSNAGSVNLFGYLLTPTSVTTTTTRSSVKITTVSQFSPELSKYEVSQQSSKKLKTFLEEVMSLLSKAALENRIKKMASASSVNSSVVIATTSIASSSSPQQPPPVLPPRTNASRQPSSESELPSPTNPHHSHHHKEKVMSALSNTKSYILSKTKQKQFPWTSKLQPKNDSSESLSLSDVVDAENDDIVGNEIVSNDSNEMRRRRIVSEVPPSSWEGVGDEMELSS